MLACLAAALPMEWPDSRRWAKVERIWKGEHVGDYRLRVDSRRTSIIYRPITDDPPGFEARRRGDLAYGNFFSSGSGAYTVLDSTAWVKDRYGEHAWTDRRIERERGGRILMISNWGMGKAPGRGALYWKGRLFDLGPCERAKIQDDGRVVGWYRVKEDGSQPPPSVAVEAFTDAPYQWFEFKDGRKRLTQRTPPSGYHLPEIPDASALAGELTAQASFGGFRPSLEAYGNAP